MSFMLRQGWHCQFLEEDLKTALPKKLAFLSQDMIVELARRGGAVVNLESEQAIRHGIEIGRGGVTAGTIRAQLILRDWFEIISVVRDKLDCVAGRVLQPFVSVEVGVVYL